jgi:hypothetical protein
MAGARGNREGAVAFVYAVRCNFAKPEAEAAWNAWYNGPKLASLLSKPMFLAGQRFWAAALDQRRKYLALWYVESPEAFSTPEYKADWGFGEWAPFITDWSRDLYRAPDGDVAKLFAVGVDEALRLISFDGMSEAEAAAEADRIRPLRPGMQWLEAVGLDRHSPLLALGRVSHGAQPEPLPTASRARETVFKSLLEFARANVVE